jgi:hypothetical protein
VLIVRANLVGECGATGQTGSSSHMRQFMRTHLTVGRTELIDQAQVFRGKTTRGARDGTGRCRHALCYGRKTGLGGRTGFAWSPGLHKRRLFSRPRLLALGDTGRSLLGR